MNYRTVEATIECETVGRVTAIDKSPEHSAQFVAISKTGRLKEVLSDE